MDLPTLFDRLAHTTLLGIALTNWALAAGAALLSYVAMRVLLRVVLARVARLAGRTTNRLDDTIVEVLGKTNPWLMGLIALLIGVGLLDLPARWSARVGQLWFIVLMLQIGLWCGRAVTLGVRRSAERHDPGNAHLGASTTLMTWGLRLVLWSVVVLAMLSNLGVNITAFVASLGVGGIAVALAVQNILGDLFASLAIAIDKPFEVGDAIAVSGKLSGTVEHVGLKTTRLRAPSGEQIVISNTELLKNPLNNYKRLNERQVVLKFALAQDTAPERAEAVPPLLRRIVGANPKLRFDRAHLVRLGEHSLDFELVYVVLEAAYQVHMDAQQRILLELMRELRGLGVELAAPARSLLVTAPDTPTRPRPTATGPVSVQTAGSR